MKYRSNGSNLIPRISLPLFLFLFSVHLLVKCVLSSNFKHSSISSVLFIKTLSLLISLQWQSLGFSWPDSEAVSVQVNFYGIFSITLIDFFWIVCCSLHLFLCYVRLLICLLSAYVNPVWLLRFKKKNINVALSCSLFLFSEVFSPRNAIWSLYKFYVV